MKISVPVPVFAASALTAIIAAGVLLTSRPIQTANAPATITKIIEVPVEREVVRERIITRTLYARPPRSSRRDRARPAANEPPPNVSIAGRATRTRRDEPDDRRQIFARASVEGFRPAADANLRIVKEPEQ